MSDDGEDWRDGLSEGTRKVVDQISLRHHGVGLERIQRCHLGLDEEEMEFSAVTVAAMIQNVADQCDECDAFTLHAVVNALLGKDKHHRLELRQRKPGKWVNPTIHSETHNRNQKWLWWLAHLETQRVKTESAIADIAKKEGVSRAAVFAGIRQAEQFLITGLEAFPDSKNFENPRPAKKRNT